MRIDRQCPICTVEPNECYRVGISPFLRERMFSCRGPRECMLMHCKQCDLYFFDIRPDDCEMATFYDKYRSAAYQQQRQSFEESYTASYNAMIGNNPKEVASRIANLERVLAHNNVSSSTDVLDYGGNDGRFIPGSLIGMKYCYDISKNDTVEGVISVDVNALADHQYGLVLLCHVLEHISSPKDVLTHVTSLLKDDGYLYVEVPFESGLIETMIRKNQTLTGVLIRTIKRNRPGWFLPKMSFGVSPWLHEHLNHFTPKALETLMSSMNLKVLETGTRTLDFGFAESKILYCLAKKQIIE